MRKEYDFTGAERFRERKGKTMKYKYPYIPKKYYAAVMFACKMIRENGYFNKAITKAADYYDVNEVELAKHVRARQGAGQKGTTRKYKWYLLFAYRDRMHEDDCGTMDSWSYNGEEDWKENIDIFIKKATSLENAEEQLNRYKTKSVYEAWFGSYFDVCYSEEFDSEEEANERKKSLSWGEIVKLMDIEKLNVIVRGRSDE